MATLKAGLAPRVAALVIVLATVNGLASCTSRPAPTTQPGDATTITEAEIDSSHVSTAYDVIHKLRPQLLLSRGKLTLDPRTPPALPRIYVDDQFYGDATTLKGIPASTIGSIRYYSASAAQYKFGHDNAAGVIAIVTKR